MLSTLLDALFPRKPVWDERGFWITDEEWKTIPFEPYCALTNELTERGIGSLDSLLSAARYRDSRVLQKAISVFKYKKIPGLTQRLAELIIRASLPYVHYDIVLTPVPLYFRRKLSRGFNQAELLARRVAHATDIPYMPLLKRVQDTGHQAWRSRYERMQCMEHAFKVLPHKSVPRHVVLIDDIATTGATLDACSEVLKKAGASCVDGWVIARV